MKIIMQYLARITHYKVSAVQPRGSPVTVPHLEVGELEKKVLSTNPFLESFGNAKTLMNDNSRLVLFSYLHQCLQLRRTSESILISACFLSYISHSTVALAST